MRFDQCGEPGGEAQPLAIDLAPEVERRAEELTRAGWTFVAEVCEIGVVHLGCGGKVETLAVDLVPWPKVQAAAELLVERALREWALRGCPRAA